MPLISGGMKGIAPPPASHWGEPKGRVRHVEIRPDGLSAIYVIEEEPAQIDYKMHLVASGRSWSHKIWVPWRYFFVNVRYDTRVESGNMGYLFFAKNRLESMDSSGLLFASMPNIFSYGGVCLGYTNTMFDRSPVRAAWRAVRAFYQIPGNAWLCERYLPRIIRGTPASAGDHSNHRLDGTLDHGCRWAAMSREQVLEADWDTAYSTPRQIVLGSTDWRYQKGKNYAVEDVDRVLRENGVEL